jgi:hypothetical protein
MAKKSRRAGRPGIEPGGDQPDETELTDEEREALNDEELDDTDDSDESDDAADEGDDQPAPKATKKVANEVTLDDSYMFAGKLYGPGKVVIDDKDAREGVTAAMKRIRDNRRKARELEHRQLVAATGGSDDDFDE